MDRPGKAGQHQSTRQGLIKTNHAESRLLKARLAQLLGKGLSVAERVQQQTCSEVFQPVMLMMSSSLQDRVRQQQQAWAAVRAVPLHLTST